MFLLINYSTINETSTAPEYLSAITLPLAHRPNRKFSVMFLLINYSTINETSTAPEYLSAITLPLAHRPNRKV